MSDPEAKISALPCWRGTKEIVPLSGVNGAIGFRVKDERGLFFVRLVDNAPNHLASLSREAAAQRAAHSVGLAPRVVYAGDGAIVSDFIEGRAPTLVELMRRIETIVMMLRRCHLYGGRKVLGETAAFWVFQVLGDYAHQLKAAAHPLAKKCPRFMAIAEKLEDAQAPMRLSFGHNELRPENFIDDGDRLWLIDWKRAAFGSALFDLATLSLSCGFDAADDRRLLDTYFGGSTAPEIPRSFAAMKVASSLHQALGATLANLHTPAAGIDQGAQAARAMKKFEALYSSYQDKF